MRPLAPALGLACALLALPARAADLLVVLDTVLDRPTLRHLGVQVLIDGDDDRDAVIGLRYRLPGDPWTDGAPLHRVRPELVTGLAVPEQFAGTAFDLFAGTTYELELHATDPDGLDMTWSLMATTRTVPADPPAPHLVDVADAAGLAAALAAAAPGDVIQLADGTYGGTFALDKSGTPGNPIVLRGASTAGTILDGGGDPGNVLEVYASFVHVERMTLRNANRAIRFQTAGAEGNVVRRVHIEAVQLGIGGKDDQLDFYLCDNTLQGPLSWPHVYADDGGMFANIDGINVMGHGHVVCHNELVGFGDAIKTSQDGARAIDIYGNLTRSAYDNAIELDGSAGNTRAVRNLLLNSYSPLSYQPIFGGPAYALRNVVVNVADEQNKLHSNGNTGETVGAQILHNTFVSPRHAINLQAAATAHDFRLAGNLFVGPAAPEAGKTVDWSVPIDGGTIDGNGWYPDGAFDFDDAGNWPNFAAMQASGVFESAGVLLDAGTFQSGLAAPASYMTTVPDADPELAPASPAVDAAPAMPGINHLFVGAAPDLGARERGCDPPIYGPRPDGTDEVTDPPGCGIGGDTTGEPTTTDTTTTDSSSTAGTTDQPTSSGSGDPSGPATTSSSSDGTSGGPAVTDTVGDPADSGCACRSSTPPGALALLAFLALPRRRRRAFDATEGSPLDICAQPAQRTNAMSEQDPRTPVAALPPAPTPEALESLRREVAEIGRKVSRDIELMRRRSPHDRLTRWR